MAPLRTDTTNMFLSHLPHLIFEKNLTFEKNDTQTHIVTSAMLLRRARIGASGKAETKIVMNPNCKKILQKNIVMNPNCKKWRLILKYYFTYSMLYLTPESPSQDTCITISRYLHHHLKVPVSPFKDICITISRYLYHYLKVPVSPFQGAYITI